MLFRSPLPLTFRHRAGVRPYTSPCGFAEPCVFGKQSPPPTLCPPPLVAQERGPLLPKLRGQFAEFLQHRSLKRLGMLYQSTCVGFGYGLTQGLFPGSPRPPLQSSKEKRLPAFVTPARLGTIHPIPIGYGCRPRLRGRLTLRGLALRRNPRTSGGSVSHAPWRYSCQHSHSPCLQPCSRTTFTGLGDAPLPLTRR